MRAALYDPVSFRKTKHVLRAAEGLRHYVATLVFVMTHVKGNKNLADIMTKAQAVAVYIELMALFAELHQASPWDSRRSGRSGLRQIALRCCLDS